MTPYEPTRKFPSIPQGRTAKVLTSTSLAQVQAYLPDNYTATEHDGTVWIAGYDRLGWTLDGYVLPRLASGLIIAEEVGA